MPLVLVWAGEHYVVDTLLGAGYAAVVVLVIRLFRTRPDDAPLPTVDA
jgi:hypothetical protein